MKILVLNGPNLNMLGMREEDIYGSETLDDIEAKLKNKADSNECEVYFYQSNAEHELIDAIHTAFENGTDSIIFNPAGVAHPRWQERKHRSSTGRRADECAVRGVDPVFGSYQAAAHGGCLREAVYHLAAYFTG